VRGNTIPQPRSDSAGKWHILDLTAQGANFRVCFDGELLFEANDGSIDKPGKVGVWTKADSVTYFDDLKVEARDRR